MPISPRLRAILQALLVTFLWSTSWVLIKVALDDIPPLTFAGLRYTIAFFILLPGLQKHKDAIRALSSKEWRRLAALGIVFYTLTQGGQFLTLKYLEAVTFSLLLNFTALLVVLFGIVALAEVPSSWQWAGFILLLVGVLVYFYPVFIPAGQTLGLTLAGITVGANAAAALLGRSVNRQATIPPLVVTVISMGIGAILLLTIGLAVQGLPPISPSGWAIVGWLAVINTALAFTLWNVTLRTLSAMESSIINNTMLLQIAVLAWVFLDERLTLRNIAGLLLVAVGVFIVQVARPMNIAKSVGKPPPQRRSGRLGD
jgi:drug/metabolite transporter (DMT)-like permease